MTLGIAELMLVALGFAGFSLAGLLYLMMGKERAKDNKRAAYYEERIKELQALQPGTAERYHKAKKFVDERARENESQI